MWRRSEGGGGNWGREVVNISFAREGRRAMGWFGGGQRVGVCTYRVLRADLSSDPRGRSQRPRQGKGGGRGRGCESVGDGGCESVMEGRVCDGGKGCVDEKRGTKRKMLRTKEGRGMGVQACWGRFWCDRKYTPRGHAARKREEGKRIPDGGATSSVTLLGDWVGEVPFLPFSGL